MRVKVLSRNPDDYVRETKLDLQRVPRNYDPALHPFEVPREYIRALNATKLERVFAKPFLGSLDGHRDGVNCMAKHPKSLSTVLSGACDGEVKIWNLTKRQCIRTIQAHEGFVRGICARFCGTSFFTVGDDRTVKQWKMESPEYGEEEPIHTILGKTVYTGIDHHWKEAVFATCGQQVDIWDEQRTSPMCSLTWGFDSISSVKFNPIEAYLLGSCASDRNIVLYDMRKSTPLKKVILNMRTNTLCWNPMEAFIFTAANEDYNLYTFDMRFLESPVMVHMDHVSAVLDVDYSPTGKEFVSASFDKSIRIFPVDKGHSRQGWPPHKTPQEEDDTAPQRPVPQISLPPYSSNTFPSKSVKPPPKPSSNTLPGAESARNRSSTGSLPPRLHLGSYSRSPSRGAADVRPPLPIPSRQTAHQTNTEEDEDSLHNEWYVAYVSRPQAEAALRKINKDGTFLVRDSSRKTATHPYVLMVLYRDKVYNIQIRYQEQNHLYLLGTGLKGKEDFSSVADIIDYFQRTPLLLIDGKDRGSRNQCMLKYAAGHI